MYKTPKISGLWFQLMAAFFANVMAITDGMAFGWTAPMIPYFLSDETHIVMSRAQAEWMESTLLLGSVFGLPLTAYVVEKSGRKKSVLVACVVLIFTWILIGLGDRLWHLYVARFVQGIALNMAFVAAPMYVGEIADKNIRGLLSGLIFTMCVLGITIIYTVGPLLPYYVGSVIAVSILAVDIVAFSFMPESPYFLTIKGRFEEAASSLRKLRQRQDVEEELNNMKESIKNEYQEKIKFQEIFLVKNYRKSILIMIILNFGQLFCSFEVILMNLHEILNAAGSIYVGSTAAGILFAAMHCCSSISASLLVDKFGRKMLLVLSTFFTGICLFALALYFHLKQLGFNTLPYSWVPIASVMLYAAVFQVGLGTIPIVMTAEIFASKIKAFGMTFSDGVYVVSSILSIQLYFFLRDSFGMFVPFYTFFGFAIWTLLCVAFYVPETKGKSLEQIQEMLKE